MEEMDSPQDNHKSEPRKRDYALPLSIVIAALLISGSWIYTAGLKEINNSAQDQTASAVDKTAQNPSQNVAPITSEDYVRGNPNASVTIVEFSDLECPFCKQFHGTMKQVMADYGDEVAWVYRHFPLDSLHPKARTSAMAAECAGKLGGNKGFWAFVDEYYEVTPSNNLIDIAQLPQIANAVGIDTAQFEACVASGEFAEKVERQVQDAINAGGRGTPYSVVINENGETFPINGALPYTQVKAIIDQAR